MEPAGVVVLSPHPDDAVFSAWHVLSADPPPLVVTVFAGIPEGGFVTALDRDHGARESAGWARRRRAEDRAALALAGCDVVHCDLLDLQYRALRFPELARKAERNPGHLLPIGRSEPAVRVPPDEIDVAVGALLGPGTVVHAPAGIGGHPDHVDVARYAVALVRRVATVHLYADSPYFLRHGLPSWVSGTPHARSDADADEALRRLGLAPERVVRRPMRLEADALAAKERAMRAYETEFAPVDADFGGIASDADFMRHEASWMLR